MMGHPACAVIASVPKNPVATRIGTVKPNHLRNTATIIIDTPSAEVWDVMEQTPRHTYQILTKRPERMRKILADVAPRPLPNVWLGTSVENVDVLWLIDEIRETPAVTRFISFEPLIGSVATANLEGIHWAIVGGESGPGARPMDEKWVDEIHKRCEVYGTVFFFKQWGGKNKVKTGRTLHGRTWDEMPVSTFA